MAHSLAPHVHEGGHEKQQHCQRERRADENDPPRQQRVADPDQIIHKRMPLNNTNKISINPPKRNMADPNTINNSTAIISFIANKLLSPGQNESEKN